MDPTFSEFSYGYTVTEELATGILGYQKVRPMFPSLYDEGQAGGGFDVVLPYTGAPLYLQFKRSHYMIRPYAENWDLFDSEYYRMYLMSPRYSQQHELLIHLELSGNDVYYIAPEFYLDEQLAEHYDDKAVYYNSALFVPSDIGHINDDERHYVAFNEDPDAWICSGEPRKLERNLKGRDFSQIMSVMTTQKSKRIDNSFFDNLIDNSITIIKEQISGLRVAEIDTEVDEEIDEIVDDSKSPIYFITQSQLKLRESDDISSKARFAGFLARTYFGSELFIVGE